MMKESSANIAYVGNFRFPDGDAAAARVLGIGKALRHVGYNVVFGGAEAKGRPEDAQEDGTFVFDGFRYASMGEIRAIRMSPWRRLGSYLQTGEATRRWLERLDGSRLAAVVLYNGLSAFHWRIGRFCQERRIPIVVDSTEWYSPAQCVGGRFGLHRWDLELSLRRWNPGCRNVIAISRFLADHYRSRHCRVLRLPPMIDLRDRKWQTGSKGPLESPLHLIYAGSPGKKDLIIPLLVAMRELRAQGKSLKLEFVGPTSENIGALLDEAGLGAEHLRKMIVCTGRIPQAAVPARIRAADLGLILRPDARFARAGFPTKLVEYLAAGTAVLANRTGDIGEHVRDGEEGILLNSYTAASVREGIERALSLGKPRIQEMGDCARRAGTAFDYRCFIKPIGEFFGQLNSPTQKPHQEFRSWAGSPAAARK